MSGDALGRVWTIGHSNRLIETFAELLSEQRIDVLVDVRAFPRSRHNPQFDRDALTTSLERAGIAYRHEPNLGGRRRPLADSINRGWQNASFRGYADHMQTAQFAAAVDRLLLVARETRTALMCAEAVPWRCHRSLVADALVARGLRVVHIVGGHPPSEHRLTPFARVDGLVVTYPGLR